MLRVTRRQRAAVAAAACTGRTRPLRHPLRPWLYHWLAASALLLGAGYGTLRYQVAAYKARALARRADSDDDAGSAATDAHASSTTTTTHDRGAVTACSATTVDALLLLPLQRLSAWFGQLAESDALPRAVHTAVIQLLVWWYRICLADAATSTTSTTATRADADADTRAPSAVPRADDYATLQDFYVRPWRPDARPIAHDAVAVSPCDGVVLAVQDDVDGDTLVQVKGIRYGMRSLLRVPSMPAVPPGMRRVAVTVHLRVGDFHHVIAPRRFCCDGSVYIPGGLLPTTPAAWHLIAALPTLNERVVVHGRACDEAAASATDATRRPAAAAGAHRKTTRAQATQLDASDRAAAPWLAMALVGSTLSGRIHLAFDARVRTNLLDPPDYAVHLPYTSSRDSSSSDTSCSSGGAHAAAAHATPQRPATAAVVAGGVDDTSSRVVLSRGAPVGTFYWGSAVVLVLDVPHEARLLPRVGTHVRAGAPLLACDATTKAR